MPRRKQRRQMIMPPNIIGFEPVGFASNERPVSLFYEEYEAIRLCDYLGQSHHQAAKQMMVSRPTLTRILEQARVKIARALIDGRALLVQGGCVTFAQDWYRCQDCCRVFTASLDKQAPDQYSKGSAEKNSEENSENKTEEGTIKNQTTDKCPNCHSANWLFINPFVDGQGETMTTEKTQGYGPDGHCICIKCGKRLTHQPGVPCKKQKCPECNRVMVREGSVHHKLFLSKK